MIVVSSCLIGKECRYDAKSKTNEKLLEYLEDKDYICVCPEEMGGLPTSREPAEELDGKILTVNGKDVTVNYEVGAQLALEMTLKHKCDKAILKGKSPMCGKGLVYDGSHQGKLISGDGVFVKKLLRADVEVINSDDEFFDK